MNDSNEHYSGLREWLDNSQTDIGDIHRPSGVCLIEDKLIKERHPSCIELQRLRAHIELHARCYYVAILLYTFMDYIQLSRPVNYTRRACGRNNTTSPIDYIRDVRLHSRLFKLNKGIDKSIATNVRAHST